MYFPMGDPEGATHSIHVRHVYGLSFTNVTLIERGRRLLPSTKEDFYRPIFKVSKPLKCIFHLLGGPEI